MDIASCNLDGSADAVEFCPHSTFHDLLAAATYTLHQDGAELTRSGSLSLFSATSSGLKLLHRVQTAGVFDIKWNPCICEANLLAQAGADGFLTLYTLHSTELSLLEVCKEEVSSSMCLFLDWSSSGSMISLGLSDGCVSTALLREDKLQISQSWKAHEYETWAVSSDARQPDLLYTGSDDCCFSCWDLRQSPASPVFRNANSHKMGVCCIAQCPRDSNRLLTGSYDEFVRVWDARSASRPVVESSACLGGGVWRLKHHPWIPDLVLAACMHGGFAIVKVEGDKINILETYTKHESLAYGADWQRADDCVEQVSGSSLVATCSFYDRLLRLWKPQTQGCDGSLLLDDTPTMIGEKLSLSNINSLRSYYVIDEVKDELENVCPGIVSCADIIIMASRDAVALSGGPEWEVKLGRKDSLSASQEASDKIMPSPRANATYLINLFQQFNLSVTDLVALSGSHSIGMGRCFSIVFRLYNQSGTGLPDPHMDPSFRLKLDRLCPVGGDGNVTGELDATPIRFDNQYFKDLVTGRGFLNSDQTLYSGDSRTMEVVKRYSWDQVGFFSDFVEGMVKLGDLQIDQPGEIRRNCRVVNSPQQNTRLPI